MLSKIQWQSLLLWRALSKHINQQFMRCSLYSQDCRVYFILKIIESKIIQPICLFGN